MRIITFVDAAVGRVPRTDRLGGLRRSFTECGAGENQTKQGRQSEGENRGVVHVQCISNEGIKPRLAD